MWLWPGISKLQKREVRYVPPTGDTSRVGFVTHTVSTVLKILYSYEFFVGLGLTSGLMCRVQIFQPVHTSGV